MALTRDFLSFCSRESAYASPPACTRTGEVCVLLGVPALHTATARSAETVIATRRLGEFILLI
jgi:hypothetical protein